MGLRGKTNIFVDSEKTYDIDKLIKLSETLPIEQFDLSSISLDDVKFITWKLNNVRDVVVHYKRIRDADLSRPILIRAEGTIVDGYHRIIKGIAEGRKWLPGRRLTPDLLRVPSRYKIKEVK